MRSTCYLSEARAVITPEAHARWVKLIEEVIFSQPEIAEAFQDPRRIFNNVSFQDYPYFSWLSMFPFTTRVLDHLKLYLFAIKNLSIGQVQETALSLLFVIEN